MKMRLTFAAAVLLVLAAQTEASAQDAERPSAVGVGVETMLAGATGPAVIFQTPIIHIEGILAFFDIGDETDLAVAGRVWYALAQTARSDFSIGGGIGILVDDDGMGDNDVGIEIDLGAQLRAFIVPNVALSVTLGFSIVAADGPDPIALNGDLLGTTGIAYFF